MFFQKNKNLASSLKDVVTLKWDEKLRRYSKEVEYINNIVTSYLPKVEKTKTDVKAYVKEIFPFLEEAKETEQLHGFKPLAPSEKLPWEE